MPFNEPALANSKAHAQSPLDAATTGEENEHRPDAASHAEMNEQEPIIDEFGLPVKRPNRRIAENGMGAGDNAGKAAEKQSSERDPKETLSNGQDNRDHNHEVGIRPAERLGPQSGSPEPNQPGRSLPANSKGLEAENCATGEIPHNGTKEAAQAGPVIVAGGVSEWSHQALAPQRVEQEHPKEEEWQDMPAFAPYDLYDDNGKLIAREIRESDDEANAYLGLGGAGRGYTRIQIDEDAQSATSMDDNTEYLFKKKGTNFIDEDDDQRDPLAQMQATKDLLTEGQRIAYVGVTRLAMAEMVKELEDVEGTKATKKELRIAFESTTMWSQKMMVRLYAHMEIDSSEQVMIEQLAEHGVQPGDLTTALMQNSRVKNPMAEDGVPDNHSISSPTMKSEKRASVNSPAPSTTEEFTEISSPPPYVEHEGVDMPEVRTPSQLPTTKNIDIDLRWTVLCDLFLVLIADSIYDSRSRVLLERVGASMEVSWLEICRFEKRVTDSLEMQEAANKETWDEAEHMENRRKLALKRKYMMMGLATVGGSLVIGLSAGLLAPVIGAGLAAGFTTIGVAGTSGFLAGAGGTALITSGAVVTGGTIAVRASNKRTGAVQTFEYRPLHNNKRVNLIVTISGWMNGKVDDVRLPYSTVDPIMGDMYSVLWEPEMLQSMGQTINILATEALTQGLQQVLGSTILVALMASLQLPIVLTKLSYLIDNPWTVSLGRANAAGLILADSLIDRNLGVRPITLVGFSLGCRVIFSCLKELAAKGAYGLIQNVYLFGSPIVANKDEYLRARTVISGRFVNGYASNDWILGYLFRATSGGIMRIAGLAPVMEIPGLENIDVTQLVNGHMAYRSAMPRLLREVGWEVESDEFTEIEDPDPENHEKRQRELIHELDEARKDAETKPEKRRFGFFKRGKLAEKKRWETYDDSMREGDHKGEGNVDGGAGNILFDIDAIKAELASEQIEVKQLESTLPPMKINLNGATPSIDKPEQSPCSNLRETKSYEGSPPYRPNSDALSSQASLSNGQASNPFNKDYDSYDENGSPENVVAQRKKLATESHQSPSPGQSFHSAAKSPGLVHTPELQEFTPHPPRPELTHSMTMPAAASGASLEHNAWLDEEDEGFGKEKEIKMTFA